MTQQLPPGFEIEQPELNNAQSQSPALPPGFEVEQPAQANIAAPAQLPPGFQVEQPMQEQPLQAQPVQQPMQNMQQLPKTQLKPMAQLVAEKTQVLQGDSTRPNTMALDAGRNLPIDVTQENNVQPLPLFGGEAVQKRKMEAKRRTSKDQLEFDTAQGDIDKKYGVSFRDLPEGQQYIEIGGNAVPVQKLEYLESEELTGTAQDSVIPIDVNEKIESVKQLQDKYEPFRYTLEKKQENLESTGNDIKALIDKGVKNLNGEELQQLLELSTEYKAQSESYENTHSNYMEQSQDLQILMNRPLKDNTTAEIFGRAIANLPEQFLQMREGVKGAYQETIQADIQRMTEQGFEPLIAQKLSWIKGDNAVSGGSYEQDVINRSIAQYKAGQIDKATLNKIGNIQIELYTRNMTPAERGKFKRDNRQLFTTEIEKTKKNIEQLESEKKKYEAGDNYLGWLVGASTEAIGQMAPAAIVTLITRNPELGMSLMFAQEFGSNYAEYINDPNLTIEQRQKIASTKALASAITEKLPLGVALKQFDNLALKTGKTAGAESVTEVLTEALHIGLEKGIIDQNTTIPEAIERLTKAGIVGGVVGGTMGAGFGVAQDQQLKSQLNKSIEQAPELDVDQAAIEALQPDQTIEQAAEPEQLPEMTTEQTGEYDIKPALQEDQEAALNAPELPEGFELEQKETTETETAKSEEPVQEAVTDIDDTAKVEELPEGFEIEEQATEPQVTTKTTVVGSQGDQIDSEIVATKNGKPVGKIEYSVFEGEPSIKMIEVNESERRKGVATKLMQDLQAEFPNQEIDTGNLTDEGSKWYDSLPKSITTNKEFSSKTKELNKVENKLKEYSNLSKQLRSEGISERKATAIKEKIKDWDNLHDRADDLKEELSSLAESKTLILKKNQQQKTVTNQQVTSDTKAATKKPQSKEKEFWEMTFPEAVAQSSKKSSIAYEKKKLEIQGRIDELMKTKSNEDAEYLIDSIETHQRNIQKYNDPEKGVIYVLAEGSKRTRSKSLRKLLHSIYKKQSNKNIEKVDTNLQGKHEAAVKKAFAEGKSISSENMFNYQLSDKSKATEISKKEQQKNVSPLEQEFIDAKKPKPKGVLKSTRTKEAGNDGVLYSRTFTLNQKRNMEPTSKTHLPLEEKNALDEVQNNLSDKPMPNNPPTYRDLERLGNMPARENFFLIGDRKVKNSKETQPQKREGIIMHVKNIMGNRLYHNRIKGKSVAGYYNTINGELRMAKYGDIEVLAHEMAHWLDFYYKNKNQIHSIYNKPEYKGEIESFSYTSDKDLLLTEGFAEYMRAWLTNYSFAKENAPKFTRAFEHYLKTNKSLKNKLTSLQVKMHRWYMQGDKARLIEGISGETSLNKSLTAREKIMRFQNAEISNDFKQGVFDHLHAAKVMSREVKGGLSTGIDEPYKLLQLLNGADQIFLESYNRGAPYYTKDGGLDFKGVSLDQVWGESKKAGHNRIKDQEAYFAARRAQEATKKGTEKLFTPGMIKEGLALGEKYPYFKKAFADFQEFNKQMLQFYVDSGYISQDSMNAFIKNNTAYVAFHRAVHGIDKDGSGGGSNIGARQSGSEESVLHIYQNTLKQTGIHLAAALKARAMRQLYEQTLGEQGKAAGARFITKATTDTKPITIDADQIAKTILQKGTPNALKVSDLEFEYNGAPVTTEAELINYLNNNPDLLKFWTFGHPPKDKRTDFDSYIDRSGKTKWVQINEDNTLLPSMLEALGGLNLPSNQYVKALAKLPLVYKNLKTLGITSAWQFAGGNIIRDSSTAMALSGFKFKPVYSHLKGLYYMTESLWNANGLVGQLRGDGGYSGGRVQSTMYDNWGLTGSNTEYLSDKDWYKSPLRIAKEMLLAYTKLADVSEMMTRVGFYAEQRQSGMDPVEAAWQTRQITTDFQKHGANPHLAYAVRTSAFLNAGMQGFMREMEALFEVNGEMKLNNIIKDENGYITLNSVKTRMYGVMMTLSGVAMLSAYLMLNSDDEEEREIYKNLTPDERSRFIHLPGGTKLPKPIGAFGFPMAMSEIALNQALNPDEESQFSNDDMLFAMGYHLILTGSPSVLQLPLDFISGEDWKGAPIVPYQLEGVRLDKQYNDRTGLGYVQLMKVMKDQFNIELSPVQAEYVVKNTFGYYSEYMKEYTDRLFWDYDAWGERPFQKDFGEISFRQFKKDERIFRNKYTMAYYDMYKEALEVAKTQGVDLDHLIKGINTGDMDLSEKDAVLVELGKAMSKINKAYKDMALGITINNRNPNLTAEQKEQDFIDTLNAKNKTFEETYKNFKLVLDKYKKQSN